MGTRLALHASKVMRPEPCKHLPLDTSVILLPANSSRRPPGRATSSRCAGPNIARQKDAESPKRTGGERVGDAAEGGADHSAVGDLGEAVPRVGGSAARTLVRWRLAGQGCHLS
jgi:hypothetical protein